MANQTSKQGVIKELDEFIDMLRAELKKCAKAGATLHCTNKIGVDSTPRLDGLMDHKPNGTMTICVEINGGARDSVGGLKAKNPFGLI